MCHSASMNKQAADLCYIEASKSPSWRHGRGLGNTRGRGRFAHCGGHCRTLRSMWCDRHWLGATKDGWLGATGRGYVSEPCSPGWTGGRDGPPSGWGSRLANRARATRGSLGGGFLLAVLNQETTQRLGGNDLWHGQVGWREMKNIRIQFQYKDCLFSDKDFT